MKFEVGIYVKSQIFQVVEKENRFIVNVVLLDRQQMD